MVVMIDELRTAIDGLVEVDPARLGDPASVVELHRLAARLDAVVARATGSFDAAREWEPDGAQNAVQWLATRLHVPKGVGRRTCSQGRHLRHLPACEQAWLAGQITGAHVAVIGRLRRPDTAEALARDEALLVGYAASLRFEAFLRAVAYWEQLADPDGAEERERSRLARRDVYLDESFEGMWLGKMTLDPISGTIVAGELRERELELFEAEWAATRARLGRDPTVDDLPRTAAQRRADALVEMATRSQAMPTGARRPAPLFSVLVGYETIHGRMCQLAGGTVIAPGALVPWLEEGYIERAVFKPDNRVEVSETARLFTGATRRAIELRDQYCTHAYCDRPAADCDVDHIIPHAPPTNGPTTQDNGRLLCGYHNRLRSRRAPPEPGDDPF
jgi:hypothetical protein